jgi:polysaccharide pyruvyl transferase WcaK-like protein
LLREQGNNLVLVPHVEAGGLHDRDVNEELLIRLNEKFPGRVSIVPRGMEASEVKYIISSLDWFCGTRMHSTIAGLSSCVPTVAIAYSLKTVGVFETCGQKSQVVDPRTSSTNELYDAIIEKYETRASCKAELDKSIPLIKKRAEDQMDLIAGCVN